MEVNILREKTLEACFASFLKVVPRSHQFLAGYQLLAWLQDDLLEPADRMAGIFILLEISKHSDNVFLSSVAELVDISPNTAEKLLMQEWLKSRDVGKLTQTDSLKLTGEARELDHIYRSKSVRPVVNLSSKDTNQVLLGRYEPEFLRPIPDFLGVTSSETEWIYPGILPEVLWDWEADQEKGLNEEAKILLQSALKTQLTPEQINKAILGLQNEPKIVYKFGLTPKKLPELIYNNPQIAIEVLLKLINSSGIQEYLSAIVNMDMSIHSLEVVSRLTTAVELPSEVIHIFITNCITSCRNIKEKYTKTRMIRLLCVFMQNLVKNKIITGGDLLIEIQHFCNEFSNIKEASNLYKTVRSMQLL